MAHDIKHTQLTRLGYNYQDLVCLEILIDWFHSPDLYQWVRVESDSPEFYSLDDVVALTSDNKYELLQVKFTIDASREDLRLDFDWLLAKKKNGTSLIQKWSKDVESHINKNDLSLAALKTNRIPDESFKSYLNGHLLDKNLVPEEVLILIDAQLGTRQVTLRFLEHFEFHHSLPCIDRLENKLHDSVVPDNTNDEGWYRFQKSVKHWATRKNQPNEKGNIYIENVREILDVKSSRSISQYFEVPKGYIPPSEQFHNEIVTKISNIENFVISGAPGMGKSTYLSFLNDHLLKQKFPTIRHHYSLSSQDTIDRISFPVAANSLISQLGTFFSNMGDKPEELGSYIKLASQQAKTTGKPLIIILDGLDHVWRERSDISQLNHLVNKLLPMPENSCLILGTQPINESQLPIKISTLIDRDSHWYSLPPMDLMAINSWLVEQRDSGQVTLPNYNKPQNETALAEITQALKNVSDGYPLHMLYSMKNLIRSGQVITKYTIEQLPRCPDGNIHQYYKNLWVQLSPTAKEVLYLLSCVDFPWPNSNSLGTCFNNSSDFLTAYESIEHLLDSKRSGIYSFHSSINVFLRNRSEYQEASNRLLPKVKSWLSKEAPEYWLWGWLWIIEAKLGNFSNLMSGISRAWLKEAFSKGYLSEHIEHILDYAEKVALENDLFAKLVDLRLIKIRLLNGVEFQLYENYSTFLNCIFEYTPDSYALLWRADHLRQLKDPQEIVVVTSSLQNSDDLIVEEAINELIRRLMFYSGKNGSRYGDKFHELVNAVIDILINVTEPNMLRITGFIKRIKPIEAPFRYMVDSLISKGKGYCLFELSKEAIPESCIKVVADGLIRASCTEEIEVDEHQPLSKMTRAFIIGRLYYYLNHQLIAKFQVPKEEIEPITLESISEYYLHDLFFKHLLNCLVEPSEGVMPLSIKITDKEEHLQQALLAFKYMAISLGNSINNRKKSSPLSIYHLIEVTLPKLEKYKFFDVTGSIIRSLPLISTDLYLLLKSVDLVCPFNGKAFLEVKKCSWWNGHLFLKKSAKLIDVGAIKEFSKNHFDDAISHLANRKENTAELCRETIEEAEIALEFDLKGQVMELVNQTAQHTLGYGHRKDTTLSELYDAIEACGKSGIGDIQGWLERLTPFTNEIFEFTEREIRHIPSWRINLISQHYPERLVDEFSYHLSNQNWFVLDDIMPAYFKVTDFSDEIDLALIRSSSKIESINVLEERSKVTDNIREVLNEQIKFLGSKPPSPRKTKYSDTDKDKNLLVFPNNYPPKKLMLFAKAVDKLSYKDHFHCYQMWVKCWQQQGKGLEIIQKFNDIIENNNKLPYSLDKGLELIFDLSKKLQGKSKSYKWAVRCLQINNCWIRYMGGSRTESMINKFAKIYSNKWSDLLKDSLQGESLKVRGNEWLVVPTDRLVQYLIAAGEYDKAAEVTEVMVSSIEQETAHLELEPCYWTEEPVKFDAIAYNLLLQNFFLPDRVMRLKTAKEIAKTFTFENAKYYKKLYLKYLSELSFETEISDFLSILLLLKEQVFTEKELTTNIHYPSLASSFILNKLIETDVPLFDSCYECFDDINSHQISSNFRKAKYSSSPMYFNNIERLEGATGYSLTKHMSREWEILSERDEISYFNIHNYCGDQFSGQDAIQGNFSSRTETVILSAYVRTLLFAKCKFPEFERDIDGFIIELIPLGGEYSRLEASSPPKRWPQLEKIDSNSKLPTQYELEKALKNLSNCNEIILQANAPVLRDYLGVSIDLEVVCVEMPSNSVLTAEEIIDKKNINGDSDIACHYLAEQRFPDGLNRWEIDYFLRGVFNPGFSIGAGFPSIEFKGNCVNYLEGDVCNSTFMFWQHHWYPAYNYELGSCIGTSLLASESITELLKKSHDSNIYLVGKYTIYDNRSNYGSDSAVSYVSAMIKVD
jgi:hypothetical protein